jgi:hypothetical protein
VLHLSPGLLMNTAYMTATAIVAYLVGYFVRVRDSRVAYRVGYRDGARSVRTYRTQQQPARPGRNQHRYAPGRAGVRRPDTTREMETIA